MELLYRIVAEEVMQCHIRFVRFFVQFHPAEGYINVVYIRIQNAFTCMIDVNDAFGNENSIEYRRGELYMHA